MGWSEAQEKQGSLFISCSEALDSYFSIELSSYITPEWPGMIFPSTTSTCSTLFVLIAWMNLGHIQDYYEYPKNYLPENGDRVVRAHLKRNFRSYLNKEKERLENKVNNLLDCGYRDIDIKLLNRHYFSQRTWNAICDHWGTPQFVLRSELGQKARLKLEFTSRTGAIPYEQRREVDSLY
ncbi:hypothetical protein POM88_020748 [Heracleum sosnowskyi]|uniref:Uncharacterized protein n=1 Tax=Heracleum sosnowskyi TaxID=360622 RepID=A0AAD8MT60_9APIA|nr:hypothetical protein POM88_020748 [Heracleum sosnowskyi]